MNRVFLYFCTILATFASLSGFVNSKSVQDLIFQAIFFPVPAFLLGACIKKQSLDLSHKGVEITLLTASFVALVGWAALRIYVFKP